MKTEIKKAAAVTAAMKNKPLYEAYQKSIQLSSLKLRIGELLLLDNKERRELWGLFEVLLRQHWGIRHESRSTTTNRRTAYGNAAEVSHDL